MSDYDYRNKPIRASVKPLWIKHDRKLFNTINKLVQQTMGPERAIEPRVKALRELVEGVRSKRVLPALDEVQREIAVDQIQDRIDMLEL